jgi:peroxiredoxin Q/BCP
LVAEGDTAPDFTLTSDSGESVGLSDFHGRTVVLYFYPKDDTPGCAKQACAIRDSWGEFEQRGATVLGVSRDGQESHVRFKRKYGLPFTLLSDPDHAVADAYGAWGEKKRYGKTTIGLIRSTFLIGPDGTVEKAWPRVDPATHADKVLAALDR